MFSFENDTMLIDDREDLIAVIRMRFGNIPGEVIEQIYGIDDFSQLQRLILAAANAKNWSTFLNELQLDEQSFRLIGEDFNPLFQKMKGSDNQDELKEK